MKRPSLTLLIGLLAVALIVPAFIATRFVSLWEIYHGYVDRVSDLTGLNTYLTNAAAALMFVPFLIGAKWTLSWRSDRRHAGGALLLSLYTMYNVGLFIGTRNAYFAFNGPGLKWYCIWPDGRVQLYDRSGRDPKYGIPLNPVTPDLVQQLELMQHRVFAQIDPSKDPLFTPTGAPAAWYWRDGDDWEFYNMPVVHPRKGVPLLPVTPKIASEWERSVAKRAKQQAAAATAARQQEEARQRAEAARAAAAAEEEARLERERQKANEEEARREQQQQEAERQQIAEQTAAPQRTASAERAAARAAADAWQEQFRAEQEARQEAWERQNREMQARMQENLNQLRQGLPGVQYQNGPPQNQGFQFRFGHR